MEPPGASGAGGAGGVWQYSNPVMKGDWSDPAVVRVGEDYYSVRSTFGWQPGLAVAHSKDLVHWQYIGNAFSSFPSIATGEVANGIWGSEMIFNSNTSMFMIYATYNGMPLQVFESAKPEGPYTQLPGGLNAGGGYDPGVFIDDDGRVYLVSSTGKIVELAADGKSVVNPSVSSYTGWNEGPELFKRAPYYYVTWSSNGTERGANGIINSARSMSLAGPWQPDPTNPVLQNLNRGTDPDSSLRRPAALRADSDPERGVVRHLSHLGMELRDAGARDVPGAGGLDRRRLVAPQERQAAEPDQRRPEPAVHAVRAPAQRRFLDARRSGRSGSFTPRRTGRAQAGRSPIIPASCASRPETVTSTAPPLTRACPCSASI